MAIPKPKLFDHAERLIAGGEIDELAMVRIRRDAEALLRDPDHHLDAHQVLGHWHIRQQDFDGAVRHYEVVASGRGLTMDWLNVAQARASTQDRDGAIAGLREALDAAETSEDRHNIFTACAIAAGTLANLGERPTGLGLLTRALEALDLADSREHIEVLEAALALRDWGAAAELFARVLVLEGVAEWREDGAVGVLQRHREHWNHPPLQGPFQFVLGEVGPPPNPDGDAATADSELAVLESTRPWRRAAAAAAAAAMAEDTREE